MAKRRTEGSGCLAAAIAILLMIAVITAVVVVLLNLTPNQLGLAELPLAKGESASSLGLADAKIKELFARVLQILSEK